MSLLEKEKGHIKSLSSGMTDGLSVGISCLFYLEYWIKGRTFLNLAGWLSDCSLYFPLLWVSPAFPSFRLRLRMMQALSLISLIYYHITSHFTALRESGLFLFEITSLERKFDPYQPMEYTVFLVIFYHNFFWPIYR